VTDFFRLADPCFLFYFPVSAEGENADRRETLK